MTSDLSPRSKKLWTELHAALEFRPGEDEILRRALAHFDVADELTGLALAAGLGSKEARPLLASARDASMAGLKCWQALGLSKAVQGPPRRVGRPSGSDWSAQRREGAAAHAAAFVRKAAR